MGYCCWFLRRRVGEKMLMKIKLRDGIWFKFSYQNKLEKLGFQYCDYTLSVEDWDTFYKLKSFIEDDDISAIIGPICSDLFYIVKNHFQNLKFCDFPNNDEIIWKGDDAIFIFNNISQKSN